MKKLLLFLLTIIGFASCKKESKKINVNILTSQSGYYVNQSIAFSVQGAGNLTLNWDFGDGTTGSGDTISHAYTNMGTYPVTLTINGSTVSTKKLTIYDGTSSYQVVNSTSYTQNIVSFSTNSSGKVTDVVSIGNVPSGGKSDTVFTYDADIYAAPLPAANTIFFATPARMVKFGNTIINMNSATETSEFVPGSISRSGTQSVKASTKAVK